MTIFINPKVKNAAENHSENENLVDAVSYALGKVKANDIYIQNSNVYKSPEIVNKLPNRTAIGGDITMIEEVNSLI